MSEMVDRVARAIGSTVAGQGDFSLGYHLAHKASRAAIEAMREPTDLMIDAGATCPGDGNLDVAARMTWESMINEAMK